jgi:hypothetical protein
VIDDKCVHWKEFQILASNAKCTYLRESVGTLLYLNIHGVQGVIMINVMLIAVHALNEMSCSSQVRHGRTIVRHYRTAENSIEIKQPPLKACMNITLAYKVRIKSIK